MRFFLLPQLNWLAYFTVGTDARLIPLTICFSIYCPEAAGRSESVLAMHKVTQSTFPTSFHCCIAPKSLGLLCFTSQWCPPHPPVLTFKWWIQTDVLSNPTEQRWAETPYINLPRSARVLNPVSKPQCAFFSAGLQIQIHVKSNEHDFSVEILMGTAISPDCMAALNPCCIYIYPLWHLNVSVSCWSFADDILTASGSFYLCLCFWWADATDLLFSPSMT